MSDRKTRKPSKRKMNRYSSAMDDVARQRAAAGATDEEIAAGPGICARTLYRWVKQHDGLKAAIEEGKSLADNRVEQSLYKMATGYRDPDGQWVRACKTSAIFWLRNRKRDKWRNTWDIDVQHDVSDPLKALLADIDGNARRD